MHIILAVLAVIAFLVLTFTRSEGYVAANALKFQSAATTRVMADALFNRYVGRYTKTVINGNVSAGESWMTWNVQQGSDMYAVFRNAGKNLEVQLAVSRVKSYYKKLGIPSVTPLRIDYFVDDRSVATSVQENFIYVRFTTPSGNGEMLFYVRGGRDIYAAGDHLSSGKALINVAMNHRALTDAPVYLFNKDPTPPFPAR